MEKEKVLGLFPYFGPDAIGGVQASAKIAWDAVVERRKQSTLFCYSDGNGHKRNSDNDTIIVNSKSNAIFSALSRRWQYDLVFIWHLGIIKLLPFFRFSPDKIVLMLIGIEAWRPQGWLTEKQLNKVDLFLSISDHTWNNFLQINPQFAGKPHRTVLLGIDKAFDGPTPAPQNPPVALMLSRLSRSEDYKGHREVIQAWPEALKKIPDAELWIAGDGDLRNDLEQMVAERGLQNRVKFWGRITEEKKQELLIHSRCMVMPSRGEGFGLVYLEAMRVGRPCLISRHDAGREVVNPPEAGLEVNQDNQEEIVDSLCRLLSDSDEWNIWSAQARHRYENYFTARHYQERLVSVLFP
ncbi:MAG: glycosyltransferase family 4 protein [Pyrinomonadaceae bacterium]